MDEKLAARIEKLGANKARVVDDDFYQIIPALAVKEYELTDIEVRCLIRLIASLFKDVVKEQGLEKSVYEGIGRKFRDAGRRSAPWKPTSSVVPGRPQDGKDGNRILRWLLPEDHKFYATELNATLVEIKYYLQAMSMVGFPDLSHYGFSEAFYPWLIEHPVKPGNYLDPVQLCQINFHEFARDRREVESGHIFPLDRGGKHHPKNTFLMIARSNKLQGNLTIEELLELMDVILQRHAEAREKDYTLERRIRGAD